MFHFALLCLFYFAPRIFKFCVTEVFANTAVVIILQYKNVSHLYVVYIYIHSVTCYMSIFKKQSENFLKICVHLDNNLFCVLSKKRQHYG